MLHFTSSLKRAGLCGLLFMLVMLITMRLSAQTFPAGFSRVRVITGITNPTAMAFASDGRIFITEQDGALKIVKGGVLLPTPALQISVSSTGERGLTGIVLDPNFTTNHYIYLYYCLPTAANNRISRFTITGDIIDPASEVVVLDLDPLSTANIHNSGNMHFYNGVLYVSIGDNAKGANAQNLDTYLGKIIRINPDGSVPAGNPYTTGTEQRKRVWVYGLRNPFTFSIQPGTGRIFVNDVGEGTWEEINDATVPTRNFGWPTAEGASTNPAFTNPVYAFHHGTGSDSLGCAITGGVFLNSPATNYPAEYIGRYFFQDYCTKWINMLDLSGTKAKRMSFGTTTGNSQVGLNLGLDGNLYYLDRGMGYLYKIIYTATAAPGIVSQPVNVTVSEGQPASFSVTATGAAPLTYQWYKNNAIITGAKSSSYTIATTTAADAGSYTVKVMNGSGTVTSKGAMLTITQFNAAPVAQITAPVNAMYRGGDIIAFSGNATDAEDGTLPASAFTWEVDFHHNTHIHDGPPVASGVKTGTITIPNAGETSDNVWYRLILIVKDSKGLADTTYTDIMPRKSTMSFTTQPAGLQITLDGQPETTPLAVVSVEGVLRSIGVVSPQTTGGKTYTFDHWVQGGSDTQTIPTPVNDATYTAVYTVSATINGPPTTAASNLTFSAVSTQQLKLSFTKGNGQARLVVFSKGTAPTFAPQNGQLYTPGTLDTNQRILTNDTTSVIVVSGLVSDTPYYVSVFEYNTTAAGFEYYLLPGTSGNTRTTSLVTANVYITKPANGTKALNTSLNITTLAVAGATSYTVELNTKRDFTGLSFVTTFTDRTLYFTGLSYSTTYYGRVKTNVSSAWGVTTTLTTGPPEQFSYLTSPSNASVNVPLTTQVTANIISGAGMYTIEINAAHDFTGTSILKSGIGRTYSVTGLVAGTNYYVRVKTDLSANWGPVQYFTTATSQPYVTSPVNNALSTLWDLNVATNAVTGATTYTVELNTAPNFTGTSFLQTASTPSVHFSGLAFNTPYYNRVKTNLSSSWGPTGVFTTGDPKTFSYLVTPQNGATNTNYALDVSANAIPTATQYTIELNTSPDFTGTSIVKVGATWKINFILSYNTTYYGRVKTNLLNAWGPTISSFTTGDPVSLAYINSPLDHSTGVPTTVNVTANSLTGATSYTIELNTAAAFNGTSIVNSKTNRTISFAGLALNTTYYARVKTDLSPGQWGTTVRSFTTSATSSAARTGWQGDDLGDDVVEKEGWNILVLPNPFSTRISILVENAEQVPVEISIINMLGKEVFKTPYSTNQNLETGDEWANGIYIVKVKKGVEIKTMRVVKFQ